MEFGLSLNVVVARKFDNNPILVNKPLSLSQMTPMDTPLKTYSAVIDDEDPHDDRLTKVEIDLCLA